MRSTLLALLVALGLSHAWRVVRPDPPPSVIGTAIVALRVEGKTFLVTRLADGDCAVTFGGKLELPLDAARYCRP